jgi:hypothetical protein
MPKQPAPKSLRTAADGTSPYKLGLITRTRDDEGEAELSSPHLDTTIHHGGMVTLDSSIAVGKGPPDFDLDDFKAGSLAAYLSEQHTVRGELEAAIVAKLQTWDAADASRLAENVWQGFRVTRVCLIGRATEPFDRAEARKGLLFLAARMPAAVVEKSLDLQEKCHTGKCTTAFEVVVDKLPPGSDDHLWAASFRDGKIADFIIDG